MPRTIWTKPQTEPNGTWSRHEGEPPFSIPANGGMTYDVLADTGEAFTVTTLIAKAAPTLAGEPAISGIGEVNQSLTAAATSSTSTAPITTTWQWLRDGIEIPDADSSTYTLVSADEGHGISVRQTDTNAYGSDSATSAVLTVKAAHEVPVLSGVPAISGIAEVKQTLTATAAPSTGTKPITTNWRWLRDGIEIPDADSSTYTLVNADAKTDISVRQIDTNAYGSDSATSEVLTIREAPAAPAISGKPTLSGIAQVGETLTATAAPVTGTAPITTTWQWLRNGTEIVGATGGTYALLALDSGAAISARQIATNAHGNTSAVSDALTVQAETLGEKAAITALLVSDQNAAGEIDVSYTISADSLVHLAVTTTGTPLAAADLQTGAGAKDNFTDNWITSGGSDTLPDIADGLAAGTYYLQAVPAGGGDGSVFVSNGFSLDTAAPTFTAATNGAGNQIVMTFNEPVSGTQDVTNWTVSGGLNVTTISPLVSSTEVTLGLDGVYSAGDDTITVSYAGGDIRDDFANDLAVTTDAPVTNAVETYSDRLVTIPADRHIDLSQAPSDSTSFLLFWSGLNSMTSRAVLADWETGRFRVWLSNGGLGLHVFFQTANKVLQTNFFPTPSISGIRYHVLVETHVVPGTGQFYARASLRAEDGSPEWVQAVNLSETGNSSNTLLYVTSQGPSPQGRLYGRLDNATQGFTGQQARLAAWVSNSGSAITDVFSPTAQNWFVDAATGLTVDPATSQTELSSATRIIDLYGAASKYQTGANDGTLTLTPNSGTAFS